MSFHPNDVVRRGRAATIIVCGLMLFLTGAFFRTQILRGQQWVLQSEENRLREVPLPAPRGTILDRKGEIIAENIVGYTVSILGQKEDSLRATMKRLGGLVTLSQPQIDQAVRRYKRAPNRPTVLLSDASFDVISVLEEHRVEFPSLIIQSSPKRFYPDGPSVVSFTGYTGEISEAEMAAPEYQGYKAGQQIGKQGLEKQYESHLRGVEGSRFVEVDARGRVLKEAGARADQVPRGGEVLQTNIDLDLQRYAASLFGDTLQGGVVALDPKTGEVLALYSAPSFDPNRFIGGIPADYWNELRNDPRRPLYNKALQGQYPPGSTWKLVTSIVALEGGIAKMSDHMPIPCTGGMQFGSRYFRCWDKRGHGSVDLTGAISKSCDVYFYQLGLRIGLARFLAGGTSMGFNQKAGIDLPEEKRPRWPETVDYYNRRYGPRNWTNAVTLNLSIGQGENVQTILSMARFYTALATDGTAAKPEIVKGHPERKALYHLSPAEQQELRLALASVVSSSGTANSARIQGVVLAGKTGTAQSGRHVNGVELNHAWFVGFAPADDPKIVVAVMLEYVPFHGTVSAGIASKIIAHYLKVVPISLINTEG
ncbi:MAG: penicillin-binding protein 2 [Gemmatimonadetes bacterium]|nr:penicillin-binding protein 2 [Gemmatimonadota bacterium]